VNFLNPFIIGILLLPTQGVFATDDDLDWSVSSPIVALQAAELYTKDAAIAVARKEADESLKLACIGFRDSKEISHDGVIYSVGFRGERALKYESYDDDCVQTIPFIGNWRCVSYSRGKCIYRGKHDSEAHQRLLKQNRRSIITTSELFPLWSPRIRLSEAFKRAERKCYFRGFITSFTLSPEGCSMSDPRCAINAVCEVSP